MHERQRKYGAAIQDAVNEVDPLDWPSTEGNIVNEFKTDWLAQWFFPHHSPMGKVIQPTGLEHSINRGLQAPNKVCREAEKW